MQIWLWYFWPVAELTRPCSPQMVLLHCTTSFVRGLNVLKTLQNTRPIWTPSSNCSPLFCFFNFQFHYSYDYFYRELVKHGVDVGAQNNNGETVVHNAALAGKVAALRWLANEEPAFVDFINSPNKRGDTPLHLAARAGKAEAVKVHMHSVRGHQFKARAQPTLAHKQVLLELGVDESLIEPVMQAVSKLSNTKVRGASIQEVEILFWKSLTFLNDRKYLRSWKNGVKRNTAERKGSVSPCPPYLWIPTLAHMHPHNAQMEFLWCGRHSGRNLWLCL